MAASKMTFSHQHISNHEDHEDHEDHENHEIIPIH
jgi:hypothetical protein